MKETQKDFGLVGGEGFAPPALLELDPTNVYVLTGAARDMMERATRALGFNRTQEPGPLPTAAASRKAIPVATGFLDYFPRAIVACARLSKLGNEQHNPGKPLHWDRAKSGDERDALARHLLGGATIDHEGVPEPVRVAWRAMASAEKYLEKHPWTT